MKKMALLIMTGALLTGCSRNPFHSEMRGVAFWESPNRIYDAFNQESFEGLGECFSIFMVRAMASGWDGYQLNVKLGMGIPQNMAHRVIEKHKTLVRKEDIASVEWENNDSLHACGAFEFDAFYGNGRVVFKAMRKNKEWVIYYMAIPRKDSSDEDRPYVVFDLSEADVEELMK